MEIKLRNLVLTVMSWTFALLFLIFSILATKYINNKKIARTTLVFLLFTWIIQNVYWYDNINHIISTHLSNK
jgi:hypothetical protein